MMLSSSPRHSIMYKPFRRKKNILGLVLFFLALSAPCCCGENNDAQQTAEVVTTAAGTAEASSDQLVGGAGGAAATRLLEEVLPTATSNATRNKNSFGEEAGTGFLRSNQRNAPTRTARATALSLKEVLVKAGKRALGGGLPGALAGIIQVITLMWLRTVINYQCRYGSSFLQALSTLLKDGGIGRLYRGVGFALVQAPLARFVSTASNDGIQTLLRNLELTKSWGPGRTTVVASIVVGCGRIFLMPIDTMKVVLQVESTEGFKSLLKRLKMGEVSALYQGALATAVSAIVGHYPWFFTYNFLSSSDWLRTLLPSQLLRNAGIGLAASVISDVVVNALRVIKTTKQSLASQRAVGYVEAVRIILAADGWKGLFSRGLRARIFANALQSIMFTVVWRGLAEYWQQWKRNQPSKAQPGVRRRRQEDGVGPV